VDVSKVALENQVPVSEIAVDIEHFVKTHSFLSDRNSELTDELSCHPGQSIGTQILTQDRRRAFLNEAKSQSHGKNLGM
jgi:hypothetical protein